MPRYLAIDCGSKRIGLAVGDSGTRLASPLVTLDCSGAPAGDVAAVIAQAASYGVDEFVVGLPLNMDGTEGKQAKIARRFGGELSRRSGKPVHFHDERLSSIAADEMLRPAELSRKKKKRRRDRVAAQVFLQDFLDGNREVDSGAGGGRGR